MILMSLLERSRTLRFEKPERFTELVKRFPERSRVWTGDGRFLEPMMRPPRWFPARLTSERAGRDQSQRGTEPRRELRERLMLCSRDMFLRNFHETVPLRFFAGRTMLLIVQFVEEDEENEAEEPLVKNQEMLNPETRLNALFSDSSSVPLQWAADDDGARRESSASKMKALWRVEGSMSVRVGFSVL